MKLILIHGRSQQLKNSEDLRLHWKACIDAAFEKAGYQWAGKVDVIFPFYGDDLYRMTQQVSAPLMTNILLRGEESSVSEKDSLRVDILDEMVRAKGIPRDSIHDQ